MSQPEKLKRKLLTSEADGDKWMDRGDTIMTFPSFFEWRRLYKIGKVWGRPFILRDLIMEEYLVKILGQFTPVLHKNICCGYSLEAPCIGNSNEYP